MSANILQFHHHDDQGALCLCMSIQKHCPATDHHDCDHEDEEGCSLHVDESIIIKEDFRLHQLLKVTYALFNIDFESQKLYLSVYKSLQKEPFIALSNGNIRVTLLRAPPVA